MAITLIYSAGCATFDWGNDSWMAKDKMYHFVVSGAIGAGTTLAAQKNGASSEAAPVIGMTATVGFGTGKEYYDATVKQSLWSWKDLVWDFFGGTVGCYAMMKK
ncbi:hypothetical protein ACFL1R_03940 [Candidatus Latescibacterota bacterium]